MAKNKMKRQHLFELRRMLPHYAEWFSFQWKPWQTNGKYRITVRLVEEIWNSKNTFLAFNDWNFFFSGKMHEGSRDNDEKQKNDTIKRTLLWLEEIADSVDMSIRKFIQKFKNVITLYNELISHVAPNYISLSTYGDDQEKEQ